MIRQYPPTVPAAFAEVVEQYPDRPALIGEDGRSWTYSALDDERLHAARALIALGVQAGDRVSIWAQNCSEWVIAGLAIHSVGAILVPINTRMKGQEVGYALKNSGARILLCPGDFLDSHYPTLLGDNRPDCVEQIVVIRDARREDMSWDAFLAHAESVSADEVMGRCANVTADSVMDIMFTSGTTNFQY